ncbi:HlyD family efflux transporter periplasmic adaptor subunit [Candidatus Uhrbacteria bacterium]|nr:HlyD family efflux transporter periplasmic adaptor subunit [Candidatus Uhrbacteria bacterium]
MRFPRFRWILLLTCVLVGGGIAAFVVRSRNAAPTYATVPVTRRDLAREVVVTGTVKPAAEVALAFEGTGRIAEARVAVGSLVTAGQPLLILSELDLRARLAQRRAAVAGERAALAELRRGPRSEDVRAAEAEVENARRALADAQISRSSVDRKVGAELADRYEDVPNILRNAYTTADDAIRKQTDVLFLNDATQNPKLTFRTAEPQAAIDAEQGRRATEGELTVWASKLAPMNGFAVWDGALLDAMRRLDVMSAFLDRLIVAVNHATDIAPTTIATYQASVNSARANVNTVRSNVDDLRQAIVTQRAGNEQVLASASSEVTIRQNALATAEARWRVARAGATREQIERQQARIAVALADVTEVEALLAQSTLRAPFDGVVTVQDAKVGAIASPGVSLVTIISNNPPHLEANIPEVDLADLQIGAPAQATFDAFGNEVELEAVVTAVDPAAVVVQGVPTYRATLAFTAGAERVRMGMTANITIVTGQRNDVLAIPVRTIATREGQATVRVLRNGYPVTVPVRLGLRGSDGMVELLDGLREGDLVIRDAE